MNNDLIQSITDKTHSLIGDFGIVVDYVKQLDVRQRLLTEGETKLAEEKKRLEEVKGEMKTRYQAVEEEKSSLDDLRTKTEARIAIANKKEDALQGKLEEHQRQLLILEGEKRTFEDDKQALLLKEAEYGTREAALLEREGEMQKQIAIDRERKKSLDVREQQLTTEQQRINRLLQQ